MITKKKKEITYGEIHLSDAEWEIMKLSVEQTESKKNQRNCYCVK